MNDPTTTASAVGATATSVLGAIVSMVDTTWPWPAIAAGVTLTSLIWGAMLKYVFTEMERRISERLERLHGDLEEKFVTQKVFDATVQPILQRREGR